MLEYASMGIKIVARNRKANFEYFLLERYEAGIELKGSEIKSLRAGKISINEAYVSIEGFQARLMEAHIAPYESASHYNHEPKRIRRLLLHKKEILEIWNTIRLKGVTVIPTQVYLKDGRAKVEIAVAKGKKLYDKRQTIAEKDLERELGRSQKRGRDFYD